MEPIEIALTLRKPKSLEAFVQCHSANYDVFGHLFETQGTQPAQIQMDLEGLGRYDGFYVEGIIEELKKLKFKVIHLRYHFDEVDEITGSFEIDRQEFLVVFSDLQCVKKNHRFRLVAGKDKAKLGSVELIVSTKIKFCSKPSSVFVSASKELTALINLNKLYFKQTRAKVRPEENFYVSLVMHHPMKGFYTRGIEVTFPSNNDKLDLLYGNGFSIFHKTLVERFETSTKGIALFHGVPGTGKSCYIRHLIKSLNDLNKQIVFIPSAVFNQIGDPSFTSFMLDEFGQNPNGTVFILEDAENLLRKRDENSEADKVSNLLNLGDGILNDLFKVQIIATFNTELENIDPAVLRSGRLLARREFKPLDVVDSKNLATHLGVEERVIDSIVTPGTLAQIFALKESKSDSILIE